MMREIIDKDKRFELVQRALRENREMKLELQLIKERLDERHAQACIEGDQEFLQSNKQLKKKVIKMKDPEEVRALAQELIPDSKDYATLLRLPGSYPAILLKVLATLCKIRRLERQLEAFESCKKLCRVKPSSHCQEMETFKKFYKKESQRLDNELKEFRAKYGKVIKSWYKATSSFKEENPNFIEDLFLIGSRGRSSEKKNIQSFFNKMFPSIYRSPAFEETINGWITEAKRKFNENPKKGDKIWDLEDWNPVSVSHAEEELNKISTLDDEEKERIQKKKEERRKKKEFEKKAQEWKKRKNEAYKRFEEEEERKEKERQEEEERNRKFEFIQNKNKKEEKKRFFS